MGLFNRDRCEGKTPEQLAGMRTAGLLVGRTLELLQASVRPGMTTLELDTLAETHIRDHGGIPNFQLVPGYRHTLCTSVNEEIVHGIPGSRVLVEGDVLSIDCGAQVGLWNGDAAVSVVVGGAQAGRPDDVELIEDTEASLWAGITALRVGESLYAVGAAVEDSLTESGGRRGREYGIVEDYVGHGIGTSMHMDPQVPNYRVTARARRSSTAPRSASSRWWRWRPGQHRARRRVDRRHPRPVPRGALGALGGRDRAGPCVLTAVDGGEARLRALGASLRPDRPRLTRYRRPLGCAQRLGEPPDRHD